MSQKDKFVELIKAAYGISDNVGRELEEIIRLGPNQARLDGLRKEIAKAIPDREAAERAFRLISLALRPPS